MRILSLLGAAAVVGGLTMAAPADAGIYRLYSNATAPGSSTGNASYTGYLAGSALFSTINGAGVTCPTPVGGCPTGDTTSSSLDYGDFKAEAPGTGDPYNDYAPRFGGLGVQGGSDGDDQINTNNKLKLTFDNETIITGILALFDSFHGDFGTNPTDQSKFAYSTDDLTYTEVTFKDANLAGLVGIVSKTFYFKALSGQPQFYISGMTTSAVPLPGAALLFGTAVAGFGLLRRRKQSQAAA